MMKYDELLFPEEYHEANWFEILVTKAIEVLLEELDAEVEE